MDKVSFYLPLTGTELLYYGITFAAGLAATVLTLRNARNGYRMNKTNPINKIIAPSICSYTHAGRYYNR